MAQAAEACSPPRVNSPIPPPPPSPPLSPPSPRPLMDRKDASFRDPFIVLNGHNFNLSVVPSRVMFYRNMYWEDFQGKTLDSTRFAFLTRAPVLLLEVEGDKYAFDFPRMLQVHVASKSFRSIAWIDEKGKPFFPVKFFDHDFSQRKMGGDGEKDMMEEDGGRGDEKCKIKMKKEENSVDDRNVKRKIEVLKPKFPSTKLLASDDKMYKFASNLFLKHMTKVDPQVVVTNIHEFQVMGEFGKVRKDVLENQIEITEAKRGKDNVVYAWYTAPKLTMAGILALGFDLPSHKTSGFHFQPSLGFGIVTSIDPNKKIILI